ncbi:helix-turn-helix domain-containing protein [Nocardia cyriacigeorgica]|uniref:Transcriptional regulator, IclR family n=2 Tax=Nocardia cyriacigeorgica TaxID=135487 RepID=H6R4N9_NOCCG|nr:helix-turn-helix domain-containing protein [Nocardia cyriacigeorgica]MBF6079839.1 helix-turn-helix domain-containing protein [Nocardia cyriacigeorgica]MBF6287128.1 helix-turn-helix domain-containing protein [Nocardia cyriacigeorgica]MBF6427999.1 helix-turn-helix domain-containing protein [Nocardia cyriacigeorgica]NEW35714.1 helix-turn-helix domain-containing protein [Nocardia cyriacigeorgica]CCF63305.1 Transcriptional regulator, IclR family [Nocardia cyriacigeorgica GUH-2]
MVERRSAPTQRVVQVLDFIVEQQGKRVGLSELARTLGLAKPTALGILTELTAGGYLVRDPRTRTYGPGPALIAAGRVAQDSFAIAGVAHPELARLSQEYRTTCTASAVVGEQIIVLESAGPGMVKVGAAYHFAPPVGLMYVLWDTDAAFDAWLAMPPTVPLQQDEARLRQIVAECRERGYLVESMTAAGRRLYSLLAGFAARELPDELREVVAELVTSLGERVYLGTDLRPRQQHPVSLLAAPTYDADGRQNMVLTMYVGASITGAEIARRGAALVGAADAVTENSGGRKPLTNSRNVF